MEEVKDGLALGSTSQVEFRGISSLGGDAASWQVKSPILAEKKLRSGLHWRMEDEKKI